MSKKFDDEYKKFISDEVPDLWERIEASLPEKDVEKVTPIRSRRNFKMLITAAACLCVLMISGGVYRLADLGSKSNMTADYMAEDCASAEEAVTEGTATEEAADETSTEEAVQNEVTEEAVEKMAAIEAEAEEETQKSGAGIWNANRETASKEPFENGMQEEATMQDSVAMDGEAEKSESKAGTAESLEGLFYDVAVMVDAIENTGEEEIYYATVISTENQLKEVDGKIMFCISESEIPALEVGKTYTLQLEDVEPQNSTAHPYVVTEVYK